jgi:hypothetical protein
MIFHFDFPQYFRMVKLAWNEPNPMARRYFLLILCASVPLISTFHAICFFLDGILFPGLHKIEIKTPVFVVGHARSGTTLVHRLMSKDEGRFSSFNLYELYFPSLLQKKVIRAVARLDASFLGGALQKRVTAWEDRRYASTRDVHNMGLTKPEEDDIIFYYSCASGFWMTKLPYMGQIDFYYTDKRPVKERKRLMNFYKDCIRRQLYLNGSDRVSCPRLGSRSHSREHAIPREPVLPHVQVSIGSSRPTSRHATSDHRLSRPDFDAGGNHRTRL